MPILNATQAFKSGGSAVGNTVVHITDLFSTAELDRAERAWFTCSVQPVNYCYDGSAPATGAIGGHQLPIGGSSNSDGNYNIRNLKWIRHDTDDGAIFVTLEE